VLDLIRRVGKNDIVKIMKKGFTLIELLVVVAIIGMLSSIVLSSLNQARGNARDARRLEDLRQLQTAFELYYNVNGFYPRESAGANGLIGEGAGLDAMLAPYMSEIPVDPLGPGNSTYNYYYDGRQICDSTVIAVIFARNMENQAGNGPSICSSWGGEGGAGGANAHHIYIGPSSG